MSIKITDLEYKYSHGTPFETHAISNLQLCIDDGEFIGIMGRTGCGKTTLLHLIAGLIEPSSGHILINGEDISDPYYDRIRLRRTVGVLFQYPEAQLFESTVARDVAFGLKNLGLNSDDINERVKWALEAVGFDYDIIRDKSPLSLSGGEKRRAAIAGVLAIRPEILLMDEPIAGLDPDNRDSFMNLIRKLNDDGTTIIMVSHNSDYVGRYTDRLLLMDNGCLTADGATGDILRNSELLERHSIIPPQSLIISGMLHAADSSFTAEALSCDELLASILRWIGDDHNAY